MNRNLKVSTWHKPVICSSDITAASKSQPIYTCFFIHCNSALYNASLSKESLRTQSTFIMLDPLTLCIIFVGISVGGGRMCVVEMVGVCQIVT